MCKPFWSVHGLHGLLGFALLPSGRGLGLTFRTDGYHSILLCSDHSCAGLGRASSRKGKEQDHWVSSVGDDPSFHAAAWTPIQNYIHKIPKQTRRPARTKKKQYKSARTNIPIQKQTRRCARTNISNSTMKLKHYGVWPSRSHWQCGVPEKKVDSNAGDAEHVQNAFCSLRCFLEKRTCPQRGLGKKLTTPRHQYFLHPPCFFYGHQQVPCNAKFVAVEHT